MPKFALIDALAEKADDDETFCQSCRAPADDEWSPYCMLCGMYWKDCAEGLWSDDEWWGDR